MDIDVLEARLREDGALRSDDQIRRKALDRIEPSYAEEWPEGLHSSIRKMLVDKGIKRPYKHQAEAICKSLTGADVVLESPTASGKTLAFSLPMLDTLLRGKESHALMIYPMKALAFDQLAQLQELCQPLQIDVDSYDGDSLDAQKKLIRNDPPQILITNPEYLNASFLGWHTLWSTFLHNLKYIVIDEMHEYRGFFGANMALLLRRFLLKLHRMGATPQVFLSTATCENPVEHAKNLTGRDVELVSGKNVFRPKRHFIFVKPEIRDFQYRDIIGLRVRQAALTAYEQGLQTLVFCPTKRFLEDTFYKCQRYALQYQLNPQGISPFHADLKKDDRREIQKKIKDGDIRVVFTTNALELGLDIGGLDGVILAGFPSSTMSAWQQIGRAGRGWDKDAFVLFYAMNDPIDRFFVGNVDAFLEKQLDQLVVDPTNEELIGNHLSSLVAEVDGKLRPFDEQILGNAFYKTALAKGGKPIPGFKPEYSLNLRGGLGQSFKLKYNDEDLGQVSEIRRFREAYIGAIFTFFGRKYRVHAHEENAIVLVDTEQYLRTDPGFFTNLTPNPDPATLNGFAYGDITVFSGVMNLGINFTGYKLVDERSGEIKGSGGSSAAHYQNNLHAFWVTFPQDDLAKRGIGALEHLIRVGAMFVIPADRFDTITYSKASDSPTAYYYENYSGGIGIAKKLFEVWPIALKKGMEIAQNCNCPSGCQNCIEPAKSYNSSNSEIDKHCGIELAKTLLTANSKGATDKLENGMMIPL